MFVNIQIKSKNQNSLKQYLDLLHKVNACKNLKIKVFLKNSNNKTHQKIYTILKSPHVNKVSQEQFEYNLKLYKSNSYSLQVFKFLVIMKKIQNFAIFDNKINIKFINNNKSYKENLIKSLMPKKYKIKWYNSKLIKSYLKILDLYGTLKIYFV